MKIEIIAATENPLDAISVAAGTSYGKVDVSHKRVSHCFKRGHMSVFEQASFTVRIEGISRACSHQLVRHRLASFVQLSQRYTKTDPDSEWFVIPPAFRDNTEYADWFKGQMNMAVASYEGALAVGINPEDARYLLPEATKTTITMTMNVREFFHFLTLRTAHDAQWEIRDLAYRLADAIAEHDPQWAELVDMWINDANAKDCAHDNQ